MKKGHVYDFLLESCDDSKSWIGGGVGLDIKEIPNTIDIVR